jgi:DNA-damage-inducible protein D
MKKKITLFERIREVDENNNEFWGARKLAKALDYSDFRNFLAVIEKAKEACEKSGQPIQNHIGEINEMVSIGSGAYREIESLKLSRYACYSIYLKRANNVKSKKYSSVAVS